MSTLIGPDGLLATNLDRGTVDGGPETSKGDAVSESTAEISFRAKAYLEAFSRCTGLAQLMKSSTATIPSATRSRVASLLPRHGSGTLPEIAAVDVTAPSVSGARARIA